MRQARRRCQNLPAQYLNYGIQMKAQIFFDKCPAGILTEDNGHYVFEYGKD